jgi:hypothetical protein
MENLSNLINIDEVFDFYIGNKSFEIYLPDYVEDLSTASGWDMTDIKDFDSDLPNRRGRKPKRANLRGKKTEDLDKYWLRRFRSYLKRNHDGLNLPDKEFWTWFVSSDSEPKPSGAFKSYSNKYREFLRNKGEFIDVLRDWFWC